MCLSISACKRMQRGRGLACLYLALRSLCMRSLIAAVVGSRWGGGRVGYGYHKLCTPLTIRMYALDRVAVEAATL